MTTAPVTVPYDELRSGSKEVQDRIVSALGSEQGCLGIIVVSGLPAEFAQLRERLFHLAHRLANASDEVRQSLEAPDTSYFFGWSHGKERMNGRLDTAKGSFYANPLIDHPNVSDEQKAAHPEYYKGNVWPQGVAELADFEPTFKALGKVIYEVGLALARACEPFVASTGATQMSIERLIAESQSNKARLLHYYPETASEDQLQQDSLCGTHLDHSLLTGLCIWLRQLTKGAGSAMYLSTPGPEAVPAPSARAGLYIYPRNSNEAVKVSIPPDCLAFQTGEALELLTGGKLAATPHFVSGNAGGNASVSRETFAFFLQPDVDDVIGPDGETFGAFTKRIIERHYQSAKPDEAES